ncbi:hypothetical protein E2562_027307 [Oryza meyeriana var. granulata]|uniref:Uncharacterized protein n=1 Tax=Oryza meyeriana var. granulata TaxID=110450 RepID=A0A6G1C0R0_9ORYZ|nr:hypothetical protein E2562_027307 [Oryza meyeriana var. granulata]
MAGGDDDVDARDHAAWVAAAIFCRNNGGHAPEKPNGGGGGEPPPTKTLRCTCHRGLLEDDGADVAMALYRGEFDKKF